MKNKFSYFKSSWLSKVLLLIVLNINIHASLENEIEENRFLTKNDTVIDNFTEIVWEKNYLGNRSGIDRHARDSWTSANQYCQALNLGEYSDWRLPTSSELQYAYNIRGELFSEVPNIYRQYRSERFWAKEACDSGHKSLYFGSAKNSKNITPSCYRNYQNSHIKFRCVRSKNNFSSLTKIKQHIKNRKKDLIYQASEQKFNLVKKQNTPNDYKNFIKKYPKSPHIGKAKNKLKNLYLSNKESAVKQNSISAYHDFLKNNSTSPQREEILDKMFNLIKTNNNISGYEWFVENYPNDKQTPEAIETIHKLAYEKSKEINTISSYNTFIIAYPYAQQVKEAVNTSLSIETKKYDELDKDEERKARILAVKIKKMSIIAKKSTNNIGHQIIINRMSNLLTTKYEETDAALRYYESKEFTNFATQFEKTMKDIKNILNKINNHTENLSKYAKEIIKISKDGFDNMHTDTTMAKYKLEEHQKWEKFMHFQDKGYQ